jgi:hypothetical protein
MSAKIIPGALKEKELDAIFDQPAVPKPALAAPGGSSPDQRTKKVELMERDAKKMGIRHGGLTERNRKRIDGIRRAAERAPLVQERDLFGQEGELPTGWPAKGNRLNSTTAEPRLREAYNVGLAQKPHRLLVGSVFVTPSRRDVNFRGKGDGLSGDPMDPYAIAHALGRVTRLAGTPSKVISVSLCGEMGAPGWEGEGDSVRGPVGHIIWGIRLDCPVYDVHPFLFANGQMPEAANRSHVDIILGGCTGSGHEGSQHNGDELTLEWVDGTSEGPTVVLRHLPLVADRFGIQKFIKMLERETVLQSADEDGNIRRTVEVAGDLEVYRSALRGEMRALTWSNEIKSGTVLILTVPGSFAPLLNAIVEEELTTNNGWTFLESFVAHEEEGRSKHSHDGRALLPRTVSIWKKNQTDAQGDLSAGGGAG